MKFRFRRSQHHLLCHRCCCFLRVPFCELRGLGLRCFHFARLLVRSGTGVVAVGGGGGDLLLCGKEVEESDHVL